MCVTCPLGHRYMPALRVPPGTAEPREGAGRTWQTKHRSLCAKDRSDSAKDQSDSFDSYLFSHFKSEIAH